MNIANPRPTSSQTTVASTIATARNRINGEDFVAVADCVDTLLDCFNAAVRPDVKDVVQNLLPEFTTGNVRKAADFKAALDEIQLALQVDAAFDEVDVAESTVDEFIVDDLAGD